MAVHRADGDLGGQLGRIPLRAGDVLLVLADDGFVGRWRDDADFSLVAAVDDPPPERRNRTGLVVAATLGMILLAAFAVLNLFEAAVLAAIVAGGAISMNEGLRAINVNVVATMAVSISLGSAVSISGLADEVAGVVERSESLGLGNVGIVLVTMLATIVLTELTLSTLVTSAIILPIAFG